ncbi:hypothetical protein B1R32_12114 [Abditibacterium utsteinense]|uniref:Uncharacterized protein n=1 Tax=Abditibacterium utsteinense TaxID=1960156 RepID=A0A2S8SPS7_9BACT|nr:hypothetical protein [Abditibacterium utsteinense]PQV62802.1 hypothetical protein B1R32_12114 [Abditibacterium utsteinense]
MKKLIAVFGLLGALALGQAASQAADKKCDGPKCPPCPTCPKPPCC